MNSGVIASRYATAFLEYVQSRSTDEKVYEQTRVLLSIMGREPRLRTALSDRKGLGPEVRRRLLAAAVAPAELCPEFEHLLTLMERNSRVEYFRLVLLDFLNRYRESKGIEVVQITTASPQKELVEAVTASISKGLAVPPLVNHKTDPGIIGGVIVETWKFRVDASVRRNLDDLKEELTEINRRLV